MDGDRTSELLTRHDKEQVNCPDSTHKRDVVAQLEHSKRSISVSSIAIGTDLFSTPFIDVLSIEIFDLEDALRRLSELRLPDKQGFCDTHGREQEHEQRKSQDG